MKTLNKLITIVLVVVMSFGCFQLVSFAVETETETLTEHLTEVPEGYVGIYTKEDLMKVHYDATAKYILMNDICFNYFDFDENYNDGNGWIPFPAFSGTFDGNGYKIANIRISGDINDAGLFSNITSSASVKNLFLENININVTGNNVGGITGKISYNADNSNYIIENCMVSGNIFGGQYVSGICGYASVPAGESMRLIKRCCNAATVTGTNSVGGVLGYHYGGSGYYGYTGGDGSSGYLTECVNTGNISGNSKIGGLIGYAYESYSQGTYGSGSGSFDVYYLFNYGKVEANNYSGGIIGAVSTASYSGQFELTDCYNAGLILSNNNGDFGAIIGNNAGSIGNSFYVNDSASGATVVKGTALTSDQLKLKNMGSKWTVEGREDYPYPELVGVPLLLPTDVMHRHEYISKVTKEASHLEEGVKTYGCGCGESYTEVIEKIAEHNHNSVVTAPTCTEQGYTTYTCECGDTYIAGYIDALGHSHTSKITTPATHTTTGVKTYTCHCGDTYTEIIEKIAEHNYTSVVTKPTCTEQGYTTYTCECGDSYVADYVDETGHNYVDNICADCGELETILNGWQLENGKWAYYVNNEKLTNKWIKDSVGWCYVGADGYCVINAWAKDSQGWCYLDSNGRMVYNKWINDDGTWYFIDANGYMVSNQWRKDSKGWCYLGSSGAMLTNVWVKDSVGWCFVDADGYCVTNTWKADSKGWCYLGADGRMVTNQWVKDSVDWCYIGSNGYILTEQWVCDNGKWYYLDSYGYMITGVYVINGKAHTFNTNGVWIG